MPKSAKPSRGTGLRRSFVHLSASMPGPRPGELVFVQLQVKEEGLTTVTVCSEAYLLAVRCSDEGSLP